MPEQVIAIDKEPVGPAAADGHGGSTGVASEYMDI